MQSRGKAIRPARVFVVRVRSLRALRGASPFRSPPPRRRAYRERIQRGRHRITDSDEKDVYPARLIIARRDRREINSRIEIRRAAVAYRTMPRSSCLEKATRPNARVRTRVRVR